MFLNLIFPEKNLKEEDKDGGENVAKMSFGDILTYEGARKNMKKSQMRLAESVLDFELKIQEYRLVLVIFDFSGFG